MNSAPSNSKKSGSSQKLNSQGSLKTELEFKIMNKPSFLIQFLTHYLYFIPTLIYIMTGVLFLITKAQFTNHRIIDKSTLIVFILLSIYILVVLIKDLKKSNHTTGLNFKSEYLLLYRPLGIIKLTYREIRSISIIRTPIVQIATPTKNIFVPIYEIEELKKICLAKKIILKNNVQLSYKFIFLFFSPILTSELITNLRKQYTFGNITLESKIVSHYTALILSLFLIYKLKQSRVFSNSLVFSQKKETLLSAFLFLGAFLLGNLWRTVHFEQTPTDHHNQLIKEHKYEEANRYCNQMKSSKDFLILNNCAWYYTTINQLENNNLKIIWISFRC